MILLNTARVRLNINYIGNEHMVCFLHFKACEWGNCFSRLTCAKECIPLERFDRSEKVQTGYHMWVYGLYEL